MFRRKKKIDPIYNDCWMYILLLTTLVILIESLKNYTFKVSGVYLSYSLLFLPVAYFLVNYIAKTYDYKKAITAICMSAVMMVCFISIMSFSLGERLILTRISGEFCGYVISQFVNLTIYMFLLNNTCSPWLLVFLNYLFSFYHIQILLIYSSFVLLKNHEDY